MKDITIGQIEASIERIVSKNNETFFERLADKVVRKTVEEIVDKRIGELRIDLTSQISDLEQRMDEHFAEMFMIFDRRVGDIEESSANYLDRRQAYKLVRQ